MLSVMILKSNVRKSSFCEGDLVNPLHDHGTCYVLQENFDLDNSIQQTYDVQSTDSSGKLGYCAFRCFRNQNGSLEWRHIRILMKERSTGAAI